MARSSTRTSIASGCRSPPPPSTRPAANSAPAPACPRRWAWATSSSMAMRAARSSCPVASPPTAIPTIRSRTPSPLPATHARN
ncbi:hypothetical protein G6F32_017358 [Rhizopus arrhizus]|nr:hypothetical protein G6F32_017358 [Rhizopus arrhizus]